MKRGATFVFDSRRFSLVYLDFASMHLPPGLENPERLHRSTISLTEGGYYNLYSDVMCFSSRRISAEGAATLTGDYPWSGSYAPTWPPFSPRTHRQLRGSQANKCRRVMASLKYEELTSCHPVIIHIGQRPKSTTSRRHQPRFLRHMEVFCDLKFSINRTILTAPPPPSMSVVSSIGR
jgi:hypothetical protein